MAIKILDNETTEKRDTKISSKATVEEYVNQTDWRVNSNANTGGAATHPALINTSAGKIIANYWLDQVYSKKEGDAHRNGDYHIHDLDNLAAYCFTKDTKVKTVEYGDISIEELLAKNVESFTVKSTDLEAVGKYELKVEEDITEEDKVFFYTHFMNKTARNLRKTRENAELVAVEFEDGLVVKCTPDHKFLTATTMVAEEYTPYMVFAWDVAEMLKKGDKIVSVNGCTKVIKEVTKLPNREDVYCMEVEDTHCFALENGAVVHNCCGHDLQKLLNEGFNGVAGRVGSKAPKHIREALYQMANFIGILQAEWAGAQAFSSFDTYLAPLVFFDMNYGTLNFDELKKAVRNFVFNLNVPSRWGQSPFSNITIDLKCPNDLKDRNPMREHKPFFVSIYEEYKETLDKVRSAIKEQGIGVMPEGITDKEMEVFMSWDILMQSAEERLKSFGEYTEDMDEETICYSLCYKHFDKEMKLITKAYYEVMNEGDAFGLPFTFPIPTINIGEDFDWDNPEYDVIWDNTAKYGSSYFQNFIGSQYLRDENGELTIRDENAYSPNDVRSMAFLGTQNFIYRDKNGRVSKNEIRHLVRNWIKNPEQNHYEFLINGEFHNVSEMFEIDYTSYSTYNKFTFDNGYTMKVSKDHKCAVLGEDGKLVEKLSQDVQVGDKFVISSKPWGIDNGIGNTQSGRIIGYYLAEGWADENRVMFAINIEREDIVKEISDFFTAGGIEVRVEKQETHNIFRICVFSRSAVEYVHHFVNGGNAKEKGLTTFTWNTSDEFRNGIFDGYYDTDGSKKSKCFAHTTNKGLCEDLIMLASSLGKAFSYSVNENNTRYFKADKSDLVYFTSYKLSEKSFDMVGDYYVVSVISNEELPSRAKSVYNFTIDTPEHLVELPNGIISPQCCRLQLDKRALRKRGGGLFGSDSQTGSIGVVTINLARIGYNFKGDKKAYMKQLYKLMDMAKSTLEKKRAFVTEMVKRGLYPYTRRYVNSALNGFTTYFSTIGVNGMNESIRNFTNDEHDITDEWGQEFAKDVMAKIRERLLQYQEETGNLYNAEASPGEGCLNISTKLMTDGNSTTIGELAKEGTANLLSFNRKTGKTEVKSAKVFLDSVSSKHYVIGFKNGLVIGCTTEHPFAVVKDDDFYWSPASGLVAGDVIKGLTDDMEVASIGIVEEEMPVYNATVEDNENFYMGDEEHGFILTHNTTYRFAKEDAKRFGDKEVHYIICEKHGKVEVSIEEGTTEIECPFCASEKNND